MKRKGIIHYLLRPLSLLSSGIPSLYEQLELRSHLLHKSGERKRRKLLDEDEMDVVGDHTTLLPSFSLQQVGEVWREGKWKKWRETNWMGGGSAEGRV